MKVTPWGDPNAHGTIGKAVTFVRRRGIVYAKPYKVPRDPRTPDQLAQRQEFTDGKNAWLATSAETKIYYNKRAEGNSYTGYNLFMETYLTSNLPSTTPMQIENINNAWLGYLRSANVNGWKYTFKPSTTGAPFGHIFDNENSFHNIGSHTPAVPLRIDIVQQAQTINIHFRDTLTIDYNSGSQLTIFLPDTLSGLTLFVADDGSTYFDNTFLQLACASEV